LSLNGMSYLSFLPLKHLTNRISSQLWPLNSLRCPRSPQSICTLESVGTFPRLFLPALSQQPHECPSSPHVRPSSPHAHTHTCTPRIFSFRFRAPSSSAPFDLASSPNESSTCLDCRSYAFVEFRSTRDAEDAYYDMYVCYSTSTSFPFIFNFFFSFLPLRHGRMFEGSRLGIQVSRA
jgi:hypothetical protein